MWATAVYIMDGHCCCHCRNVKTCQCSFRWICLMLHEGLILAATDRQVLCLNMPLHYSNNNCSICPGKAGIVIAAVCLLVCLSVQKLLATSFWVCMYIFRISACLEFWGQGHIIQGSAQLLSQVTDTWHHFHCIATQTTLLWTTDNTVSQLTTMQWTSQSLHTMLNQSMA